jgi:hypothetical protein
MKHQIFKCTLFLAGILSFTSCTKDPASLTLAKPVEPTIALKSFPTFTTFAVHILEREFLNQKALDSERVATLNLNEYIEARLLELYPDQAYEGMMDYYSDLQEQYILEYELYLQEEAIYDASIGIEPDVEDEIVPFTTLEAEIEYSALSEEEVDLFLQLEEIALMDPPADIVVLDSLLNADGGRLAQQVISLSTFMLIIGNVPYTAFRLLLARKRAESKTEEFYNNNSKPGQKGDAFRHMFLSMYLKRYLGRSMASYIMHMYELYTYAKGENNPPNMFMDLHNNYIGYRSKYGYFRARTVWDLHRYWVWASRVRSYVNHSTNGVLMEDWESGKAGFYPESYPQAEAEADAINNTKYIWFTQD